MRSGLHALPLRLHPTIRGRTHDYALSWVSISIPGSVTHLPSSLNRVLPHKSYTVNTNLEYGGEYRSPHSQQSIRSLVGY